MNLQRIEVDFNNCIERGRVIQASLRRLSSNPQIGEAALLYDGEGNSCSAIVERIDNSVVYFALDLDTWEDGQ